MSVNGDPTGKKRGRRLSPEELAGEVARRLRLDRGGHRRRRRFDIVSASRIAMVLGVILVGIGAVFAAAWIGRLVGFETTGTVIEETPVYGCPGEPELGVIFSGETVQLVGVSRDGVWYALRDERGPGDVVYADALRISPGEDFEKLPIRDCDPRSAEEIAAEASTTTGAVPETTALSTVPATTVPGESTTTSELAPTTSGRPPRRGSPSPGTTTTTTTTTRPGATTTTTRPATTTTRPGATTTTRPPTTTTSSTSTTSTTATTQPTTTTTTEPPTTTTEPPTTTTTEPPPTTTTTEVTTTTLP